MLRSLLVLLVVAIALSGAKRSWTGAEFDARLRQHVRTNYPMVAEGDVDEFASLLVKAYANNTVTFEDSSLYQPDFECKPFQRPSPYESPTDINKLKIYDIDIVMALGDSLTAGFAARSSNIFDVLSFPDYRGAAFSIGGDKGEMMLPDIIRLYNPAVTGFALGKSTYGSTNAGLDFAITGGKSNDLFTEVLGLSDALKTRYTSDQLNNQWKMLTIFIGANDLCDVCNDAGNHDADNYAAKVKIVLEYVRDNIPRTFVNLIPTLDVTQISELSGGLCSLLHNFECSCVTKGTSERDLVAAQALAFQSMAEKLAQSVEATSDFVVVAQPFLEKTTPPKLSNGAADMSYFAPDCFHFSLKAHQAAALALWNNINEYANCKENCWDGPREQYRCPTEADYLWTTANSGDIKECPDPAASCI